MFVLRQFGIGVITYGLEELWWQSYMVVATFGHRVRGIIMALYTDCFILGYGIALARTPV